MTCQHYSQRGLNKLLVAVLFLFLSSSTSTRAFALENPAQYFDYNTYIDSPQVLGVYAQEPSLPAASPDLNQSSTSQKPEDHRDYKKFNYFFKFTGSADPGTFWYPLKRLQENVSLTLANNPEKKVDALLSIAGERTSEIVKMAASGQAQTVENLLVDYEKIMGDGQQILSQFKNKPEAVPLLLETDQEVAKHLLTLEEVSQQVPESAAAKVELALSQAEKVVDAVADVAGRPAVPQEMIGRLQAYKAQGLLTEEEINKIVGSKSRVEARDEFRKFAQSRVVPLTDLKKFDEAAQAFYPKAYATVLELRKFRELKDLEKQRPDETTLNQLQDLAKTYQPGDIIPHNLREWWAPLVRLEELQATFRPDLIASDDLFKYRPEDKQKYQELVERSKPTQKEVEYVRDLVNINPQVISDPAYARILTLGEKFGTSDDRPPVSPGSRSCSRDSHWVNVPFMPNGGYCVPDRVYEPLSSGSTTGDTPCPPNYHRNSVGGACYPDNPGGSGLGSYLPAAGTCPSGYHWINDSAGTRSSSRRGYCAPDFMSDGGAYPSPWTPPSYCPQNQVFREGKCVVYNPPPPEGCPGTGGWWNGEKCVERKDCSPDKYPGHDGECRSTGDEYKRYESLCKDRPAPAGGCGTGWWDITTCSCRGGGGIVPPDDKNQCPPGYRAVPLPQSGIQCQRIAGDDYPRPSSYPYPQPSYYPNPSGYPYPTWTGGGSGSPSREEQEAACRAGGGRCVSWNNGACGCERDNSGGGGATSCSAPVAGCPRGMNWDRGTCTCRPLCGPGTSWNGSHCMQDSSSGSGGSSGSNYSGSYNPEEMCRRAPNCRWENNSCRCDISSYGGGSNTTSSTSQSSPSTSCGSGYHWNGSSCERNESSPPPSTSQPPPPSSPPPSSPPPPSNPPAENRPPPPPSNPPPAENPPPPSGGGGESAPPPPPAP